MIRHKLLKIQKQKKEKKEEKREGGGRETRKKKKIYQLNRSNGVLREVPEETLNERVLFWMLCRVEVTRRTFSYTVA